MVTTESLPTSTPATDRAREEERIRLAHLASRRLAESGSAGLLLVDAGFLAEVERLYGRLAQRTSFKTLCELTERFLKSYFHPGDIVMQSEAGLDEVLVLFFRPRSSPRFFIDTLPSLPSALSEFLTDNRSKLGHSESIEIPRIAIGASLLLHDPAVQKSRELRAALDEARRDAALMAALHERERRLSVARIVLGRNLDVVYQPIVGLESRQLYGYEALVRPPKDGEVDSPERLFCYAKRFGMLFDLDGVCRMSALRGIRGRFPADKKLFLNAAPQAIHDARFREDQLRHTLESCGLAPKNLVFELSERECASNLKRVREAREQLRGLGIEVALDDAGASLSSLASLMDLDPDYIKVDISLIRSIDTDTGRQHLLRSLQQTAEGIGSAIIAEGIETAEEVAVLQDIGVRYGQGYLLGLPDAIS
ncbi:MAG: EAL domain-containing protein [Acidobacteria bacterium]|nr:EAL domain-containing protein [Acidobacteriota bacterium]